MEKEKDMKDLLGKKIKYIDENKSDSIYLVIRVDNDTFYIMEGNHLCWYKIENFDKTFKIVL